MLKNEVKNSKKDSIVGGLAVGVIFGLGILGAAMEASAPVSDLEKEIRKAKVVSAYDLPYTYKDSLYLRSFLRSCNLSSAFDLYEAIRTDRIVELIKKFDSTNWYLYPMPSDKYALYQSLVGAFRNDFPEMHKVISGDRIQRALS